MSSMPIGFGSGGNGGYYCYNEFGGNGGSGTVKIEYITDRLGFSDKCEILYR